MGQGKFHQRCGTVHDVRVACPAADREHWIGDGCMPPHETKGEAASPDPALERIREQNRTLRGEDYEWVNHPQHYNQHPAGIECIDVVEHLSFNVGTAFKHAWRAGLKPGADAAQDLRKSVWYLNREIARLEASGEH